MTILTWQIAPFGHTCPSVDREHAVLDADRWSEDGVALLTFDRAIHELEDRVGPVFAIEFRGSPDNVRRMRHQFPLRYQRLFTKRNDAGRSAGFDRVLLAHARLHDRSKPLVRADYDHTIDVWQWTLRLAPEASEALQIAALFHDIERLSSEADVRVEQHASDYLGFKIEHAQKGAALLSSVLAQVEVAEAVAVRACALVERHEQPDRDAELLTLNEADALSWFALNSPGFLAYFGPDHTRKKVAYTLARMRSRRAQEFLREVRLEASIAAMLEAERAK